jgi:hypothetical protein
MYNEKRTVSSINVPGKFDLSAKKKMDPYLTLYIKTNSHKFLKLDNRNCKNARRKHREKIT